MENNLQITLPENWSEITLDKFCELQTICQGPDKIEGIVQAAALLSDTDPDEIKKISTAELNKLSQALQWIGDLPLEANFKHVIEIDGEEYSLIPKLHELTVGEWIDLETYCEDLMKNLHYVMAILYRPLQCALNDKDRWIADYDAKDMQARAELFKTKMCIDDVWGAVFFFLIIGKKYTEHFQAFLSLQNPMKN